LNVGKIKEENFEDTKG